MGWTAVSLASDLPERVVMAAQCGDAEIAVWRSASGQLAAWADRCPHRGMRLSHGFVRGEALNCIYHGWTYGADGGCKRIPAHPDLVPPATIKAVRFACVQAQGLVWVAPLGTDAPLPDLDRLSPVRSLAVDAAADRLAAVLPDVASGQGPLWRGNTAAGQVGLLVQPLGARRCLVHLLVRDASQFIAASRWIEGVRTRAELGGDA
jgi:nitrite reductase/ring-hydroxylating ferredoxin subunit